MQVIGSKEARRIRNGDRRKDQREWRSTVVWWDSAMGSLSIRRGRVSHTSYLHLAAMDDYGGHMSAFRATNE